MREGLLLRAAMPLQDLEDRRLQVVVDHGRRHAAPELEGVPLPQEEAVLPLGRETLDEDRPGVAQAPREVRHLGAHPVEDDHGVAEIELPALARREGQRDEGLRGRPTALAHELANRRLGHRDALAPQLDPHPVRRPALLGCPALQPGILLQPAFYIWEHLLAHRGVPGLAPGVAPLAGFRRLAQQRRHRVARDPEMLRRRALRAALDEHPVPNLIAQGHAVHLPGPLLLLRPIQRRV